MFKKGFRNPDNPDTVFQTIHQLDRNYLIKDNPAINLQPHRRHTRRQADLLGGDVYIMARIPPVARHPRYKQPLF